MSPRDSDYLIEIFQRILDEVSILSGLLQEENNALKDRDIEKIHLVAQEKQASVSRVENITKLQTNFLSSNQLPCNNTGLNLYLDQFNPEDPVLPKLKDYRETIATALKLCKSANEQNGASVEVMGRYTMRAIDVLRNRENQHVTYGPDGNTQNIPNARSRISV